MQEIVRNESCQPWKLWYGCAMPDLIEELTEALEPFDLTMSSWLRLRHAIPVETKPDHVGPHAALLLAYGLYLEDQVLGMQRKYGKEACDAGLAELTGLHDALIRVGKLTGDPLADKILIYAAHLAAMSSYGPAVWDRTSKIVLTYAMKTTEKELAKARRR